MSLADPGGGGGVEAAPRGTEEGGRTQRGSEDTTLSGHPWTPPSLRLDGVLNEVNEVAMGGGPVLGVGGGRGHAEVARTHRVGGSLRGREDASCGGGV